VKEKVSFWVGERYSARDSHLKDVEQNMDKKFKENVKGLFSVEALNSMKLLESKKFKPLLDKENDQ